MNIPRKHHFVSVFHLKGFTKEGTEDGKLWVRDTKTFNQWDTTPLKAACETDFNRTDLGPDVDPMWFERGLANEVEPVFADVLRFILDTKEIPPAGLAYQAFINFVAFAIVRGQSMREMNSKEFAKHLRNDIREHVATEEGSKGLEEILAKRDKLTKENFLAMLGDENCVITPDNATHIKMILLQTEIGLDACIRRTWVVREVAANTPDLICSENPVGVILLRSIKLKPPTPIWFHPGVKVVMPLSRRVAAIGWMIDHDEPDFLEARHVGAINSAVSRAAKQIYSSETCFVTAPKSKFKMTIEAG